MFEEKYIDCFKRKSAANCFESEDEDEEEDTVPPPKRLKTTSSIFASLPRHSIKWVSVPKQVTKAAGKSAPERSPNSTFQLVLLADAQGRLRLPNQTSGEFTPFPKFAHARNPLLTVNPDFVELGSILETQNACFTMQDLMQVNRVIRDSLKCLGSLDVELAMDAVNVLHTASTSSTHTNSLRRAADLNNQLKQIRSLFDTTRELFLRSILDLQNAGEDPIVVLEALKAAEPNRELDFNNRTPGEWIELLRSIHSGESTVHVDRDGHLVESSPPPDLAAEALEGLNDVEKGSADAGISSQVRGSIPMELDLPAIESLAKPTLSPKKGAEPAQTL
ncbi:hypothetical protein EV368DRAFT_66089 [Lentinula lateritia]|nr:hypothetical protein EV368DRAFT_66089 [Lentinula lateritia]